MAAEQTTDLQQFQLNYPCTTHVFNSVGFSTLNEDKCDELRCLEFKDHKPRMGITLGLRGSLLCSPFSAPFGGFVFANPDTPLEMVDKAVKSLIRYADLHRLSLRITLPPAFYHPQLINKQIFCLTANGFRQIYNDVNFHFDLTSFDDYTTVLWRNARKNLQRARREPFVFKKAQSQEEIIAAYNTIQQNRKAKGYPLKMSLQQVLDTINVVPADFFNLSINGANVAAAQVFHVADGIVQVIYWGDAPGFENYRPMNYLAAKVVEYYKKAGIRIVDVGPSSQFGVPSIGLCNFKESIGCKVESKFTFEYNPKP